jgi:lysine methyltransferase
MGSHGISVPILQPPIVRSKTLPGHLQPPDIVLAADCIYLEAAFPLLVSTLVALVPPPPERAPEVLLSYKKRRKADKRFFAMLKTYFTWSSLVRGLPNKLKKIKKNCVIRNVCAKIEGVFFSRSMTTVLKRETAEALLHCCVYFAARKRERTQLRTADNYISHRPAAVPRIDHMIDQDIMRTLHNTVILMNQ